MYTKDKLFQYGLNLAPLVATFERMPRLQHLTEVEVKTFAQMPRLQDLAEVEVKTFAQMPRLNYLRRCRG
jgi:hypothetical protein